MNIKSIEQKICDLKSLICEVLKNDNNKNLIDILQEVDALKESIVNDKEVKVLDQSVFSGLSSDIKYAAVSADGFPKERAG